ncbi:MAG: HAMP domain-containing protein, partial [Anaerolineales bacterium]
MESTTTTPKKKYQKLGTRLSLSLAILATVSVIIFGAVLYLNFRNQIREDLRQRLLNIISIAALQQDGDLHATLVKPEDKQSEAYRTLSARNIAILKTDPELVYFFTVRQDESGNIYFVLDNSADPTYPSLGIGDIYADPSELLKANFATLDRPIVEQDIYTDAYGTFLSAYAPFYRSDGSREGIIGVDMNASTVLAREQQFLTLTIIIVLISIPFVTLFGWILGNHLAAPISRLAITAKKVAAGDFNLRADVNPSSQEMFELQTDFNLMTGRLHGLISNLEQRVAERTAALEERNQELEAAQQQIERRLGEVLLIAAISRMITHIQNFDVLLSEITRLISMSFGYYHVGIFLNDEKNHYTVLRATNSVGGQR